MPREIKWVLDPLTYKSERSYGIIVGAYHYRFNKDGSLMSASKLNPTEAALVLKHIYGEKGPEYAAAGIRTVREGEKDAESVQEDGDAS